MKEEIIVSGRMNSMIDPTLHIWHWQIPLYLFLGGMAAGILCFAALYYLRGREKEYLTAVRVAPFLAPILLVIGLLALFADLRHRMYFWQLYANIRMQSPMSWGAWTLMVITPVSFIWSALHIRDIFPEWNWRYKWLFNLEVFFNRHKTALAWIMLIFGLILGIYTGILLSAFNARPLWNTSILGPLFLASGLSAGAATIIFLSKDPAERKQFAKIDLAIIGIELFLIIHMFMGYLASSQVQIEAARMFLGGEYTASFWIFVVILGLIIPALLEILELRKYHIPAVVSPLLVIFGSFMLRFIIVYAGQMSRYLY
ncbi:MAG: nitrite reductase [Bacteroidales bacterium]|jgi:formate-dependent nitrite reductase membrane component NrfD|nr:nitrite reductase [Bacteroidales bacterium]HQG77865.1 polysulfide reductase NrfD [Bacteroidales bacterium]